MKHATIDTYNKMTPGQRAAYHATGAALARRKVEYLEALAAAKRATLDLHSATPAAYQSIDEYERRREYLEAGAHYTAEYLKAARAALAAAAKSRRQYIDRMEALY